MMRAATIMGLAAAAVSAGSAPGAAATKARFLGAGTYATAGGCVKLKALAAGTPRNIGTVPETLTAAGYSGWEHGCGFVSVKEQRQGRAWAVRLACDEGPDTWTRIERFEKQPDGSFKVTAKNETTHLVRCDAGKGK